MRRSAAQVRVCRSAHNTALSELCAVRTEGRVHVSNPAAACNKRTVPRYMGQVRAADQYEQANTLSFLHTATQASGLCVQTWMHRAVRGSACPLFPMNLPAHSSKKNTISMTLTTPSPSLPAQAKISHKPLGEHCRAHQLHSVLQSAQQSCTSVRAAHLLAARAAANWRRRSVL
jgi:hypothetical protein